MNQVKPIRTEAQHRRSHVARKMLNKPWRMSVEPKEDGMRYLLVASSILLGTVSSAHAQVSVGIAVPGVQIGINVPAYPELVPVPGYPVYYDPRASSNFFFYDGAYWVFHGDNWHTSSWYNGPWHMVGPQHVPAFVLRVPVRYYRAPPAYFRGWHANRSPRWGEHWGHDWRRSRHGWDRWDRRAVPRAAPLPVYQRGYAADRYPHAPERQHAIRAENYRYRPSERVTREYYGDRGGHRGEGPRGERRGNDRYERGHGNDRGDRGHGQDERGHGRR